jgi:O-antigen/teichoic acid export membrane protein
MNTAKIVLNTVFLSGSSFAARGIGYLYFVLIARCFLPEEMGIYAVFITAWGILEIFSNLGIDKIMIREISCRNTPGDLSIFYISMILRLSAAILSIGLCLGVFVCFYGDVLARYGWESCLFFGSILPLVISKNIEAFFIAREKMHIPATSQLVDRLVILVLSSGVYLGWIEFKQFLCSFAVAHCLRAIFLSTVFPWPKFDFQTVRDPSGMLVMLKESMQMLSCEILTLVYFRVDMFMLSRMAGYQATGLYLVAYRVFDFFISIFGAFLMALFPSLSRKRGEVNVIKIIALGIFFLTPVTAGVIYFRADILRLFNENYTEGKTALLILMLTLPIVYMNSMLANLAVVLEKISLLIRIAVILTLGNIGLNLYLIPEYSLEGAATATLICEGISSIILIFSLKNHIFNTSKL